ncbi:MAG: Gfo/Idh/MocA family oxidoreductase [Gammaproteobacteria bacterium]|nr:Gfo/Idh/MocA family oxidoreductase [Gammaproteobacteria bacterium]
MKKFALIGASGYVAPRHVQAIKATGNALVAAIDPHDNVGFLDSYYPETAFFTEFERFDRYMDKLRGQNKGVDYVSVCSPNYLHDAHIKSALRWGADAICEKPLVLNPWNIDLLKKVEQESERKIWTILQLRCHPSIIALKKKVEKSASDKIFDVDLTYITSRGLWYYTSWKGQEEKSGGIATNIGVHFYDMLSWVFGAIKQNVVHIHTHDRASGYLEFEKARVRWFLSINDDLLPDEIKVKGQRTYRSMTIEGEELEFSSGFTDLHTRVYEGVLAGEGYGIEDARNAIEIVHSVRTQTPIGLKGPYHPFAKKKQSKHPFKKR